MARGMLLHAMIHWPDEMTIDLWPFAIEYACYIWNHTPKTDSGLSPVEIFFNTKSDHSELQNLRVFGCPVYVLEPKLQDGKKLPKWSIIRRTSQFLGFSKDHASSVALVKNCCTGYISPQFHIILDELFTTIFSDDEDAAALVPERWDQLFTSNRINFLEGEDFLPDLDADWNDGEEGINIQPRVIPVPVVPNERENQQPTAVNGIGNNNNQLQQPIQPQQPQVANDQVALPPIQQPPAALPPPQPPPAPPAPIQPPEGTRRNPHRAARDRDYRGSANFHAGNNGLASNERWNDAFIAGLPEKPKNSNFQYWLYHRLHESHFDVDNDIYTAFHPQAFSARINAADLPRYHEAMNSPERQDWIRAMEEELVAQLRRMDCWDIVDRTSDMNVISSVWAL
jgi:hypothetical protein